MGDGDRNVVVEDRKHLFREVDLNVVLARCVRPTRVDTEVVLHPIPRLGGDLTRRRVRWHVEHELLVRPDCHDGLSAEDAVDRTGHEAEVGQALLHGAYVVACQALAEGAGQRDFLDGVVLEWRGDIGDRIGNGEIGYRRRDDRYGVDRRSRCLGIVVTTAEHDTSEEHRAEQPNGRNRRHPSRERGTSLALLTLVGMRALLASLRCRGRSVGAPATTTILRGLLGSTRIRSR